MPEEHGTARRDYRSHQGRNTEDILKASQNISRLHKAESVDSALNAGQDLSGRHQIQSTIGRQTCVWAAWTIRQMPG